MQPLYKQFDQSAAQILITQPFYGQMLARLPRIFTEITETIALLPHDDGYLQLAINPAFWRESLYPDQLYLNQALQHQLLHFIFQHPFKMRLCTDKMCFSLAAEMVVLQYLDATLLLPSPTAFGQLNQLVDKQNAPLEFYYRQLLSHSGKPVLISAFEENRTLIDRQFSWLNLENIPKASRSLFLHQRQCLLWESAGQHPAADMPFAIRQYLPDLLNRKPPIQNWRRWLRRFAGHSKHSTVEHSVRRPSKRYHSYPGLRIRNRAKICVAIDVSGSISDDELQEFKVELDHLLRQQVSIKVVTFDHRIQEVFEYRGKWPDAFEGGGGTYYEPVFEYVKMQKKTDAFVIFTDGHGPAPKSIPHCPMLWVISAKGMAAKDLKQANFFGELVSMKS